MVVKTPNSNSEKRGIQIVDHSSGAFEINLMKSAELCSSYSFNRLEPNFKSHPASTPLEPKTPAPIVSPGQDTAEAILNPVQEYAESLKRDSMGHNRQQTQQLFTTGDTLQEMGIQNVQAPGW
jgi:hypothetical protein